MCIRDSYCAHLFFCTHRRPPDHPRGDCARHNVDALAVALRARIKESGLKRVRVNTAGCLHRCGHGPVLVIYPEGVWYGSVSYTHLSTGPSTLPVWTR